MALSCPQSVSHLWCMAVINGSDPVLVLVKQSSALCFPVRAARASFKLLRKKGKMSGLKTPGTEKMLIKPALTMMMGW